MQDLFPINFILHSPGCIHLVAFTWLHSLFCIHLDVIIVLHFLGCIHLVLFKKSCVYDNIAEVERRSGEGADYSRGEV